MVMFVGWMLGTQKPTAVVLGKVLLIVAGVIVASYGEIDFMIIGFTFQMAGITAEAIRLVLVEKLLRDFKMDPLVSLYYFAPVCS